jgi:hypothetical protein
MRQKQAAFTHLFPGLPVSRVLQPITGDITFFCKIADVCLSGDFDVGDDISHNYG